MEALGPGSGSGSGSEPVPDLIPYFTGPDTLVDVDTTTGKLIMDSDHHIGTAAVPLTPKYRIEHGVEFKCAYLLD